MAKLSHKTMLGVAMVLSLLTAMLAYSYLQQASDKPAKNSLPVVVAKVDILPKTQITKDMLQVTYVPAEYMQPGALQDLQAVIGIVAREQIAAGEQVTSRRLLLDGKSAGFTGLIPAGKRAVTVAVTEVTGVAGLIKPGDYVDVIVTFDQLTAGDYIGDVILQNLLVLAVNHDYTNGQNPDKDKKEAIKTATVTVAMDPDQTHYLAVGDDRGKIRLALRPYLQDNSSILTKPIDVRQLMGKPPLTESVDTGRKDAEPKIGRQEALVEVRPSRTDASDTDKQLQQEGKEIFLIRGTKAESIRIH